MYTVYIIMDNLRTIVSLSTVLPALAIALLLLLPGRGRAVSSRLLAGQFFVISMLSVSTVLLGSYEYTRWFPVAHLMNLFVLLLGPLFYLYVRSVLDSTFRFRLVHLLYFAPMALVFGVYLFKTLSGDVFFGKHNKQFTYKGFETIQNALYFLTLVPLEMQRRGISIRDYLFNYRNLRLTWLRFLHISLIVIWLNKLYMMVIWDVYSSVRFYLSGVVVYSLSIGAIVSIALYMLMNRDRFLPDLSKYRFSQLNDEEKTRYYEHIIQAMEQQQVYLENDLSLSSLAELTGIPAKLISQVVNEKTQANFTEFVNRYRINHACQMMKISNCAGTPLTILQIMYDSGFNSKSAFNTAFRKHKQMTPLEFRIKHNS